MEEVKTKVEELRIGLLGGIYEVPDDLLFMASMDDAYELAIHNIWGTEKGVYQEFLECLLPFTEYLDDS